MNIYYRFRDAAGHEQTSTRAVNEPGSWFFRFAHHKQRHKKGGFPTKALAREAGEALRQRLREQRIVQVYGVAPRRPRGVPTLARFARETFQPDLLARARGGSPRVQKSQLNKLCEKLGGLSLTALTPEALDAYHRRRRADGVSAGQVVRECLLLSKLLHHAVRDGVIALHPMKGWRWPRTSPRHYTVISPDAEKALLDAADPLFARWIVLGLATGCRKGELRGLDWSMVDLTAGELTVAQAKTGRVKVIPLHPRTIAWLESLPRAASGVLLPDPQGRRMKVARIDYLWKVTRKAARVDPAIRFHDLRHTFASRLADAGVGVPVVGELLGHKPPYRATLKYFHPLPDAKREAILRLGDGPLYGPASAKKSLRIRR